MRKGKVISLFIVVTTKIATFRHLGTWSIISKYNEFVEIGEKLVLVGLEVSGMAYERHK